MCGLWGKPNLHIRHVDEDTFTIEPQRFYVHTFWKFDSAATSRTDQQDLKDEKIMPRGSKVTKHKVDILVTPETIEPQQLYIGRIKLSFSDVANFAISGSRTHQASYQDTATENAVNVTTAITPHLYPDVTSNQYHVKGDETSNQEIGGSGSGFGIKEWMLDDHIKHWINLKKVTVYDQRPLVGSRWQRVPAKVKRANEGCFYGLFIFNDSTRGATPADTQVTVNIKSYWEELAINFA